MTSLLEPLFAVLTGANALIAHGLSAPLRLALWAAIGAVLSMELYRLVSRQARIRALKQSLQRAQHEVVAFDGPFAEGWPLVRRMLGLALKRVLLVLPATLLASLPLLVLILWLAATYGAEPRQAVLPAAPDWLAGWEAVFLPSLLVAALAYKRLRRIE